MTVNFKTFLSLIKSTYKRWDNIDPFAKSAIIAYYTLFSLPSLLMIDQFHHLPTVHLYCS